MPPSARECGGPLSHRAKGERANDVAGPGWLWKPYGSLSRPDPTHSHPRNDAKSPPLPAESRKPPAAARSRAPMVRKGLRFESGAGLEERAHSGTILSIEQ